MISTVTLLLHQRIQPNPILHPISDIGNRRKEKGKEPIQGRPSIDGHKSQGLQALPEDVGDNTAPWKHWRSVSPIGRWSGCCSPDRRSASYADKPNGHHSGLSDARATATRLTPTIARYAEMAASRLVARTLRPGVGRDANFYPWSPLATPILCF